MGEWKKWILFLTGASLDIIGWSFSIAAFALLAIWGYDASYVISTIAFGRAFVFGAYLSLGVWYVVMARWLKVDIRSSLFGRKAMNPLW